MREEPDVTVPQTKQIAGQYRLLRVLGSGGFGTVFEARHLVTDLPYAVKRLHLTDEDAARFQKEAVYPARIAGQSLHVLGVHSFFHDDQQGYFYLVTDLMSHGDLRRFLDTQPRPLPLTLALEVSLGVARGLAAIHDQGIIHRDLKPANVLMDQKDGRWVPKIADFGLARSSQSLSIGDFASPGYAAPEQLDLASDESPSTDSDNFALGVLLYEVLTGERVTPATNLRDYSRWLQARQAPEPPSRVRPELARYPDIDTLLMSLIEFDRSRRLSSASRAVAVLDRVLREVQSHDMLGIPANRSTGESTAPAPKTPSSFRSTRKWALGAAVLVLVAMAGLAWFALRGSDVRLTTDQRRVLNEAQELDRQGDRKGAFAQYRAFLASVPGGSQRDQARARLLELNTILDDEEQVVWHRAQDANQKGDFRAAASGYREVIGYGRTFAPAAQRALQQVEAQLAKKGPVPRPVGGAKRIDPVPVIANPPAPSEINSSSAGATTQASVPPQPIVEASSALSGPKVGLTGCWSYNSLLLTMTSDGKVTGFLEGGQWASSGGQRYAITWPRSVDTMTLSPDGRSLSGTNNYGGPGVSGKRGTGDVSSLAGPWQWSNGQPTMIRDDGNIINGGVPGHWTRLPNNTIRIVWEFAFIDQLTLSPDGQSVSGRSNVGNAVGGTRVPCAPGARQP